MRRLYAIASAIVLMGTPSHAYYHYVHYTSQTAPFTPQFERFSVRNVVYYVNDQGPAVFAPNDTFGSLLGQVKQAVAAWDSVPTSDLRISFGGLESGNRPSNAPGGDVIFQDLPPGLYGMGMTSATGTVINEGIVILANNTNTGFGAGPSYYETFYTTAVHEVGHSLGLQHTWTASAMSQDVIRNTSRARPLDADDVAALSVLYGKPNWQADYGSISGRVTLANGTGAMMASVVAVSPTGTAVSALTNPDGTYRIDGIPPNNYLLYVHPLPPDAVPADGSGVKPPVDQNGRASFPAPSVFGSVFYPGTTDVSQASAISVTRGSSIAGQDFRVQPRQAVPAYDLLTASFLDLAKGTSVWDASSGNYAQVYPAFIDTTQGRALMKIQAGYGDTPVPQTATILGGFPTTVRGDYLFPYLDNSTGSRSLALYQFIPLFAGTGPRALVLNYGNDLYVLPAAINLVNRPAPAIASATANADGTVTVTGTSFGGDSRIYFDGLPAAAAALVASAGQGSITVTPPAGISGQNSILTLFNSDGQNSTFLRQAPPVYIYPAGGAPQIANVSLRGLAAGATSMVDIATQNARLVDGQVTLGFGSDDVTVQRLWVVGPNHLLANVAVAQGAALGASEISVISGFQVMSLAGGFTAQPAATGLPVIALPITNGDLAQQTIYPGSVATIYGVNLGLNIAAVQVTLNDVPVPVQFASAGQVNILIPPNFPTGLAVVKLNSGIAAANPVLVQIDAPPPVIVKVLNLFGTAYDSAHSASAGDTVNVVVTGMDAGIAPGRLQVLVSGVAMPVFSVQALGGGQVQVSFVLTQGFGSAVVPLAVAVDGSSSASFTVLVR